MLKNFVFLKLLLVALLQRISATFQAVTENNRVLVGHVFQQLYARDWFNCIQACHDEPRCISYNYERSAGANGLCELNDCGVEDLCDREKSLIYLLGFVFQQIRENKVSFINNDFISLLMQLFLEYKAKLSTKARKIIKTAVDSSNSINKDLTNKNDYSLGNIIQHQS